MFNTDYHTGNHCHNRIENDKLLGAVTLLERKQMKLLEYRLAFDTHNHRDDMVETGKDIHEVLSKIRKVHPDAKHFRILEKRVK